MSSYTGKGGAVNDLVLLDSLSEEGIVECLENHHRQREIYTYIGPVLISVNPYQNVPNLYGAKRIKKFVLKKEYENVPHVYAVAERAYRSMVNDLSSECVVITGESGSGKTEASKKVMEYVAAMNNTSEVQKVKTRLLESNPLLESFGNAKTTRNDNSSRFGKYMEILFLVGAPNGGKISTYLLEKSRVTFQLKGERNFHIFYELLSDKKKCRDFNLDAQGNYGFLLDPESNIVESIDDNENFKDTLEAMQAIGIDAETQHSILSLVAFLLHLGNDDMANAASLLGVPQQLLKKAITHRTVKSGIETVVTPLGKKESQQAKESMAKAVYSKMFDKIVQLANESILCQKYSTSLGVLDIYGFEILGVNGLNQLFINYTNEKLHQLFIELTLRAEQSEYKKEGIEWRKVNYLDNLPVLQLIENKRNSVFDMLNEESLVPQGKDDALFNKMAKRLGGKLLSVPPRAKKNVFMIQHYAGKVSYSVDNFVETNKDKTNVDIVQCVSQSSNPIAASLFQGHAMNSKEAKVHKRSPTTATQYKSNVEMLMQDLKKCEQHYIRCIKPNEDKSSSMFDKELVQSQAKYLGLLENVKVRRAGFAIRLKYERFASKYKCLLSDSVLLNEGFIGDSKKVVVKILKQYKVQQYECGKSKVFIKEAKSILALEEQRKKFLERAKAMLPATDGGLIFADKVIGVNEKTFVRQNLTFAVGSEGFYWYDKDGQVAQFFPLAKIEHLGVNADAGWMTVHTSYEAKPNKDEVDRIQLTYLSENIYGDTVDTFVQVMHSMGFDNLKSRAMQGRDPPLDSVDVQEYKRLVKGIAKGDKEVAVKGSNNVDGGGCCCTVS